jgi:hypothetical protein
MDKFEFILERVKGFLVRVILPSTANFPPGLLILLLLINDDELVEPKL